MALLLENTNPSKILDTQIFLLIKLLRKMQLVEIEYSRISELASALLILGFDIDDDYLKPVLEQAKLQVSKTSSTAAIISSLNLLSFLPNQKKIVADNINLILKYKNKDGGYGRFYGDRSRIPVCWRILECFKRNNIEDSTVRDFVKWMEDEWTRDMSRGGLSYKCSGILIANSYYPLFSREFIERSLNWLLDDQNSDGGWSAKKDSPVGSVPSYTGLALRALTNYQNDLRVKKAIDAGIVWLNSNMLNSGLWKEHPIEKACIEISLFLDSYLKCKT